MNNKQRVVSAEWLLAEAHFESEHGYVGVAGGSGGKETPASRKAEPNQQCGSIGAFAQLVEFGRRRSGWSIEVLADKASVDLEELVEIERSDAKPSARALFHIAKALQLPPERLAEVAGLVQARDEQLEDAIYRFAARSEPNSSLNPQEEDAYNSFVSVLLSLDKTEL